MENKMEHEIENGQLIISFYGEIDGYNVAYYRNKLNVLLAINDDDVIFDFKHTTFIDSAGVGLVLGRYQQLSKEGRKLSLRRLSNTAYKVFELSGLFEIMEYLKEAEKNYGKSYNRWKTDFSRREYHNYGSCQIRWYSDPESLLSQRHQ